MGKTIMIRGLDGSRGTWSITAFSQYKVAVMLWQFD